MPFIFFHRNEQAYADRSSKNEEIIFQFFALYSIAFSFKI